jgi:hypothetical protein
LTAAILVEFQSLVKAKPDLPPRGPAWEMPAAQAHAGFYEWTEKPLVAFDAHASRLSGRSAPFFDMDGKLATALPHRHDFDETPTPQVDDIAALSDPTVAAIFAYWSGKRGKRRMPSRADIDPVELRGLVNNIALYDVVEPGPIYRVRLVGSDIVEFDGRNTAGERVGAGRPPKLVEQITAMLTSIVTSRTPRFRTGMVYWHRDKSYRRFQSCFLPLSPNDGTVNMILNAVAFAAYG